MRISDWSSDVCSSDLPGQHQPERDRAEQVAEQGGGELVLHHGSGLALALEHGLAGDHGAKRMALQATAVIGRVLGLGAEFLLVDAPRDRKSTRLNSSH